MKRPKVSLRQELPLLVWLVVAWCGLWSNFSIGNVLFGTLISVGITRLFYLPPVELGGRFNLWYAFTFAGSFLGQLVVASINVLYLAIVRGPHLENSVVAVQLRSRSDLLVTSTGHVVSLIPGSLIIEVDRSTSTLYVHCLNVGEPEAAEAVRARVRKTEEQLILMMGTRQELQMVRAQAPAPGKEGF